MAKQLIRATPESQGIASSDVDAFVTAIGKIPHMNSVMVLRHGSVIAEGWWSPYDAQTPHMLYSLSKSFTSTAVGLAVNERLLTVDDRVIDFFPEDAPAKPSANLAAMKVRHLLSMSTGHHEDATNATMRGRSRGNPFRSFLAVPVKHEPGTHFVYNSAATFMLAAIVEKLSGEHLVDYLMPRIFEPLGIDRPQWETHPNGVAFGGWGLFLKTEDIARFGQLYLNRGKWGSKTLIPAAWVDEATSKQVDNSANSNPEWKQGYGYQFWRCRHNAYRGDGAFGQYCVVMPDQDAVVAITSGVDDMQKVLDQLWKKLLPAMGAAPLAEDRAAAEALASRLSSLELKPPSGKKHMPRETKVGGKSYRFEKNELKIRSCSIDFGAKTFTYHLSGGGVPKGEQTLEFGRRSWVKGSAVLDAESAYPVASSGAWVDDDRFELTIAQLHSPHIISLSFRFKGKGVTLTPRLNVAFGPHELPSVKGSVEA